MSDLHLTEKQKAIVASLKSMKDEQVISLIQDFREDGELFIVDPLLEMIYSNRSSSLKETILELVGDIKDQNAVAIIAQTIQNHVGDQNTTGLLSACWQSNLDFSNYLPVFIEILCSNDYQASFEAFTVIENSVGSIDNESIDLFITTIKSKMKSIPTERQSLLTETIVMLENFKKNGSDILDI